MTFMRLEDVPDSKSLRKPQSWSRKVHWQHKWHHDNDTYTKDH